MTAAGTCTMSPELALVDAQMHRMKGEHATWRDALTWWAREASPHAAWSVPAPIYIWMIESGSLDSDPADDPADQVYFAVVDGVIEIGFSGTPAATVEGYGTLTRAVFGSINEESMLHNLFRAYADFRVGSNTERYLPHPWLVKLANAEGAIVDHAPDVAVTGTGVGLGEPASCR